MPDQEPRWRRRVREDVGVAGGVVEVENRRPSTGLTDSEHPSLGAFGHRGDLAPEIEDHLGLATLDHLPDLSGLRREPQAPVGVLHDGREQRQLDELLQATLAVSSCAAGGGGVGGGGGGVVVATGAG